MALIICIRVTLMISVNGLSLQIKLNSNHSRKNRIRRMQFTVESSGAQIIRIGRIHFKRTLKNPNQINPSEMVITIS